MQVDPVFIIAVNSQISVWRWPLQLGWDYFLQVQRMKVSQVQIKFYLNIFYVLKYLHSYKMKDWTVNLFIPIQKAVEGFCKSWLLTLFATTNETVQRKLIVPRVVRATGTETETSPDPL